MDVLVRVACSELLRYVLCRMRVDPQFIKQLNESPSNRYSFVCSALVNICNCQTHNDRLGTNILCHVVCLKGNERLSELLTKQQINILLPSVL